MMKRLVSLLTMLTILLVAGVASAHVTVWPKQSPVNGFERYTVRVPNEKDIPTVKVRVELPAGSTFNQYLPVAGWTVTPEKDASGKVVAVTWSGGQIKAGEFLEFGLSVKNPKDPADVAWKAYQTYSDGSVVEWTGAPGSDKPAPMVTLTPAAPAPADSHGATTPAPATGTTAPAPATTPAPAPTAQPAATPAAGGGLGIWLGGGALVISLAALFLALRKR